MDILRSRCLYLTDRPDREVVRVLQAAGWHVTTLGVPTYASGSAPICTGAALRDKAHVGVLDLRDGFRDASLATLATLDETLSASRIAWVMWVTEQQINAPALRRLISKYGVDYLCGAASAERVVDALMQAERMLDLACDPKCNPKSNPKHDACPVTNDAVVGNSDAMQHLFRTISKVSSTTAPVFISGESGTGKELTAASIHRLSSRRDAPFVAINCGAIPHTLMQAELFGHERGAFTGANQRRIGKIEAAHKGTLFLDEIGDLPLDSQANLLRFLQEGQIQRVGSHETINVDVRVVCATHVDIDRAVASGRFRNDLYHRLCVLRIDQPPLRARGTDVELLAMHMLERFRDESAQRIRGFSGGATEALYNYDWPGNVRELINRVRRAVVMAEGRVITAEDLELTQFATARRLTLAEARDAAEQAAIQQALRRHRNRLSDAAQELGISRVTLYRLMGNHRLRPLRDDAASGAALRSVATANAGASVASVASIV